MMGEAQDPFIKGQRIDRYEIREHVGQGGMGAVYRAVDTKLGRTVALKTVAAHRRGDKLTEEIRQRFMREALAASRVDHRNVVHVLDFGFSEDGTPYMVMEFLRGQSLSELLKRAKGPMPIDSVADIMLSVCAALRACHHVGIIHRDLKPANIFLCDTDTGWEVKVLDFGISKAPAADELTQDGQIIGTPQYLSPEQIEGAVGPESDQYALGVLLYVCLTQRLPYAGYQGVRLLRAISEGTFDPPRSLRPELPDGLEAVVLRAMHVSPAQRFESIHALGQRLWEFASPHGQGQWKTFYFHTPAAAQTAKPITIANEGVRRVTARARPAPAALAADEPLVAAPVAPGPRAVDSNEGRPRGGSTASLEQVSPLARTEPASQATIGPGAYAVTKTAAAWGASEGTSSSHSDIAGESALSDAPESAERGHGGRTARWRVALALAAVAVAGVVALQRASRSGRPAAVSPGSTVSPSVIVPPAAPATAPPPSPPPPPPSPPSPPPAREEPGLPAQPAPAPAGIAAIAGDGPRAEPSPRKHATRRHRPPKLDQHGIGIPTE